MCLFIAANVVHAQEFLEDAAQVSGYGPTRVGYSTWYAGACGDRIGASISYVGRTPIGEALPDVLQYARNSAQHLLARCPEAQTIEVNARGQAGGIPPTFYRFVMHRKDDWAPQELADNNDLIKALIDSGYNPVDGPSQIAATSFMRFADGRLDVVYGKNLEGRMSATHIEQKFQEDIEPPRLSYYIVRGNWFDLGSAQENGDCEESREGYPLWGTFAMTVNPFGNYMNVQRQRCVDHGTDAKSEATAFSDLSRRNFERLGLEPLKINKILHEQFSAAGRFADGADLDAFAQSRQPLFANENLQVFSRRPEFCSHLDADAIYRVNSESRDEVFGGSYWRTLGRILRQVATERCEDPLTVSVNNYQLGDSEPWDRMSFQLRRIRPLPFGGENEKYLERLDHNLGARAKTHDEWLGRNLLGPECTDGPFCTLPGGRYLNAIYRGDLDAVRQMDYVYEQTVRGFLNSQMPGDGTSNPITELFSAVINAEQIQLLSDSTNKYMHSYAAWGEDCLDPGAQVYKYERTEPVIVETDPWGVTTRSGGEHYEAFYTLNPEFFGLRDVLGSAGGARDSNHPGNMPSKRQVFRGIVEMKNAYGCRSPEVKEFERQLIAMTNTVIESPGTTPPTPANRPPQVPRTMAGPFPATVASEAPATVRVAFTAPAALPVVAAPVIATTRQPESRPAAAEAPAANRPSPGVSRGRSRQASEASASGGRASPGISALSPVERQQKMNQELQAVAQQFTSEMAAANQAMQRAVQGATTPQARQAVMTEYQRNMLELRNRAQAETLRIQQQYQQ